MTRAVLMIAPAVVLFSNTVAPITEVTVTTTATQAVIHYTTAAPSDCVIEAGEGSGGPLVNDVSPNLFPGSNSDARFSSWRSDARHRVFVLGTRSADRSGNVLYSRALAADTSHWFRVTCGDAVYNGSFRTRTVASGNIAPESAPFNDSAFGNYAWPTIDWSDKSRVYIDPLTGVKLRLMSTPGAYGGRGLDKPFGAYKVLAGPANWRDAHNITSGTSGTLAQYSGPGNEAIFVAVDPTVFNCPYCNGYGVSGFDPVAVIDDIAAHVYGYASGGDDSDGDVRFCLTLDSGATCAGHTLTVRLSRGFAEVDGHDVPSSFPQVEFAGWGRAIRKREMPSFGTASVSSAILTVTSDERRSYLMESYAPGSLIQIAGAGANCAPNELCSIATIDSALTATLGQRFTLTGNNSFKMANLGLKIWKANGAGTIRLRVRMDYAFSLQPDITRSGNDDRCGRSPVTVRDAANGITPITPKEAYLCGFPYYPGTSGQAMYLVPADDEPPRLISLFRPQHVGAPAGDRPSNGLSPGSGIAWDWDNPNVMYELYKSQSDKYSLYKLQYDAAGCNYKTLDYRYGGGEGGDLPPPEKQSDCVNWTNLTPPSKSRDIDSQIQPLFPEYDAATWGPFGQGLISGGISGRYFIAGRLLGGQDTACYVVAISLDTGAVDHGWRMWDGGEDSRRRFATCHSIFASTFAGYAGVSYKQGYAAGSAYGGKWQFEIAAIKGAAGWTRADTSLTSTLADGSYDAQCPANIPPKFKDRGAVGANCITLRINSLVPCRVSASAQERTSHPCSWDTARATLFGQQIIRGDQFADSADTLSERFQVVQIAPGPPIEIVALRNAQRGVGSCGETPSARTHRAGWTPYLTIKNDVCEATDLLLSAADGSEVEEHPAMAGSHHDYGAPITGRPGELTMVSAGPSYGVRSGAISQVGRAPDYSVTAFPVFANGPTLKPNAIQSYASKRAWHAVPGERAWALDYRHINGSVGAAPEIPDFSMGEGRIALTLQPGTTRIYKVTPPQNNAGAKHNPKLTAALVWAGFHNFRDKSSAAIGDVLTDSDNCVLRQRFSSRRMDCSNRCLTCRSQRRWDAEVDNGAFRPGTTVRLQQRSRASRRQARHVPRRLGRRGPARILPDGSPAVSNGCRRAYDLRSDPCRRSVSRVGPGRRKVWLRRKRSA